MSRKSLPQVPPEVSIDNLEPGARALLEEAHELAERIRNQHRGARQRWSEEGTICAVLAVHGARDVLLEPALQNHAYAHRRFPDRSCNSACLAHDLWGFLDCEVQVTRPTRDWPIRKILKDV